MGSFYLFFFFYSLSKPNDFGYCKQDTKAEVIASVAGIQVKKNVFLRKRITQYFRFKKIKKWIQNTSANKKTSSLKQKFSLEREKYLISFSNRVTSSFSPNFYNLYTAVTSTHKVSVKLVFRYSEHARNSAVHAFLYLTSERSNSKQ